MRFLKCGWIFVAISTFVLFSNFYGHTLSTLPLDRFLNNEFPSERHVIARIAIAPQEGMDYKGGFMLQTPDTDPLFMATDKEPYKNLRGNIEDNKDALRIYPSHIGFQDELLSPIWGGLYKVKEKVLEHAREGSRWEKRLEHFDVYYIVKITQGVVALINAFAISLILLWAFKFFSPIVAYLSLGLGLVMLPDLTFFGRSMWWVSFTWFLPFLTILWAYYWNKGRALGLIPLTLISITAGSLLTLKASMGYEFTSTIMVSTVIPVTFYAILQTWRLKDWFWQCFVIGIFQICGIAAALYLHYLALAGVDLNPMDVLQQRFQMRAHGGEEVAGLQGMMRESVDISLINVWARHMLWHQHMGIPQFIIMFPLLAWFWKRRMAWKRFFTEDQTDRALLACMALGGFGAYSMFTILKGHAYIHSFDVVAFSIPMNLFLCIFYARNIMNMITARMASQLSKNG